MATTVNTSSGRIARHGTRLRLAGALFATARQEGENDDRFRRRIQLAQVCAARGRAAFADAGRDGVYRGVEVHLGMVIKLQNQSYDD